MTIIHLDDYRQTERRLTKQELAMFLSKSTRWIDYKIQEGMPFEQWDAHKRFIPSKVIGWLECGK